MTTTSTTSRHDPDLLRSEVTQARGRVAQLRKELRQARAEVASARRGVDTLTELVVLYYIISFYITQKQNTDTIENLKAISTHRNDNGLRCLFIIIIT